MFEFGKRLVVEGRKNALKLCVANDVKRLLDRFLDSRTVRPTPFISINYYILQIQVIRPITIILFFVYFEYTAVAACVTFLLIFFYSVHSSFSFRLPSIQTRWPGINNNLRIRRFSTLEYAQKSGSIVLAFCLCRQ